MTLADIKNLVNYHCGTGTTDAYTATMGLLNLNLALYRVETRYLMSQGRWKYDNSNNSDFPILTTSLVASQQDYSLPTETIKIDRLEITYDGANWYRASSMSESDDNMAMTTSNIATFSQSDPRYSLLGRSLKLYPIPGSNVSNGLKIYGQRLHDAFTSTDYGTNPTTVNVGIDENWGEQVAREMSLNYLMDNDMVRYDRMVNEIERHYVILKDFNLKKLEDEKMSLEPAYENMN
jgi:hypothetical protein